MSKFDKDGGVNLPMAIVHGAKVFNESQGFKVLTIKNSHLETKPGYSWTVNSQLPNVKAYGGLRLLRDVCDVNNARKDQYSRLNEVKGLSEFCEKARNSAFAKKTVEEAGKHKDAKGGGDGKGNSDGKGGGKGGKGGKGKGKGSGAFVAATVEKKDASADADDTFKEL